MLTRSVGATELSLLMGRTAPSVGMGIRRGGLKGLGRAARGVRVARREGTLPVLNFLNEKRRTGQVLSDDENEPRSPWIRCWYSFAQADSRGAVLPGIPRTTWAPTHPVPGRNFPRRVFHKGPARAPAAQKGSTTSRVGAEP